MNVTRCIAVLAVMLVSFSVWAKCPMQETTVLFVNGVWTNKEVVKKHRKALEEHLRRELLFQDCVFVDYSHTQNDDKTTDIIESLVLKSTEVVDVDVVLPLPRGVRMLLRVIPADAPFNDAMRLAFVEESSVIEAQTMAHLAKIRAELEKGRRVVVAAHSQGNQYWEEVWKLLTPEERFNVRVVAVSSPTQKISSGGRHIALSRDGVRNRYFLASVSEGVVNNDTLLCQDEAVLEEDSWICHGFAKGYLSNPITRTELILSILDALPDVPSVAAISGRVSSITNVSVSGARVELFDNQSGERLGVTTSDASGRYSFEVDECIDCSVFARKGFQEGFVDVQAAPGEDVEADVVLIQSELPQPS